MSVASLVLDYLRVLVWPAVVVSVVLTFRSQLGRLIDELTEASGWGASVKRGDKAAAHTLKASYEVQAETDLPAAGAGEQEPSRESQPEPEPEPEPELEPAKGRRDDAAPNAAQPGPPYPVRRGLRLKELHAARSLPSQFDSVMRAGQAVWDALRDLTGSWLVLPDADSVDEQLAPLDMPPKIVALLEDIADYYNAVVVTQTYQASRHGSFNYGKACENAIKAISDWQRRTTPIVPGSHG